MSDRDTLLQLVEAHVERNPDTRTFCRNDDTLYFECDHDDGIPPQLLTQLADASIRLSATGASNRFAATVEDF